MFMKGTFVNRLIKFKSFRSFYELTEAFPDEDSCYSYLEHLRWPNGVVSIYDPTSKVYSLPNHWYMCSNTKRKFNVKHGTLFSHSRLPLRKWFIAIWSIIICKKGIASTQLSRTIGTTQKTAWFISQKIRNCLGFMFKDKLEGIVECDETFIGGKNKNRHWNKKVKNSQGRSFKDKVPVLGMLQRGGHIKCEVLKDTSAAEITPALLRNIKPLSTLFTDEWQGYNYVIDFFDRFKVDHSKHKYSIDGVTTNTIEGFWGILKRGYAGVYHLMSRKHLQKYLDEFTFRYNTVRMKQQERFDMFLRNINHYISHKQIKSGYAAYSTDV